MHTDTHGKQRVIYPYDCMVRIPVLHRDILMGTQLHGPPAVALPTLPYATGLSRGHAGYN